MNRILLLIVLPFAFLSVFSQITQEQADEIVLERISQRMVLGTVYAKKNLQEFMFIWTSANEELFLDYSCWVYFYYSSNYVNNITAHYLIVNANTSNVLEINGKSNAAPREDLGAWRVINIGFELGQLKKILDGYAVGAIAFDSKGNAWIGTNKGLVRYNENEIIVYNSGNSEFSGSIYDIAIDKDDYVWIAADGAWKFDGTEFTFYNSQNTAMPEDYVRSIMVDSKNNIWMASCRAYQGGLVKYDGTEWTVYTPDNSPLPGNLINEITIDKSDNVWVAVGGLDASWMWLWMVKISNDQWTVYGENDFGVTQRTAIRSIQFDSKNRIWGAFDFRATSSMFPPPPHFFIFDGNNATQLSVGNNRLRDAKMTIDRNDNVWHFGVSSIIGMWINEQWIQFDRSEFGGSSVWMIKEDPDGRIWFGTDNGIYIRGNTE